MMNTRCEKETLTEEMVMHIIIQSTTVLYDMMVTYLAEQNRNDRSDWIINGSRFINITFLANVSLQSTISVRTSDVICLKGTYSRSCLYVPMDAQNIGYMEQFLKTAHLI